MDKSVVVLMAVYNEEKYIREAIESFVSQDYLNKHLVIVDDFSTDNTYRVAKEYECDIITVLKNTIKGKNNAYNLAFQYVQGDYYCFLGGDDYFTPESLSCRMKCISELRSGKTAVFSKLKTFSEIKRFDGIVMPRSNGKGNDSGGCVFLSDTLAASIFPLPSNLPNEDIWISLHIQYFADEVNVVNNIVLRYRIHENNSVGIMSPFKKRNQKMYDRGLVYALFLEKYRFSLNSMDIMYLEKMNVLVYLRYTGNILSILFLSGVPLHRKISNIINSNKYTYNIKTFLYKFLAGR